MRKSLLAFAATAFAALAAPPTGATTFPELTTIYVASGVNEDVTDVANGTMTIVSCSNMSGQTATVRYVFRSHNGTIAATGTLLFANLASRIVTTQGAQSMYGGSTVALPTGSLFGGGTLQILSTQSAIFCTAMLANAAGALSGPQGIALHMVRFNPHPGTVE